MDHAWPGRLPGPLAVGLCAAIAAGSLLFAQTVEKDAGRPVPDDQTQAATTQPAQAVASGEPRATRAAADDAEHEAARERLLRGLIGSKHDFTRDGRRGRDLCTPCHTPHRVAAPTARLDRRGEATQPLRPYRRINVELTGWSLLCLGCHDGTTAPGIYSSAHAVRVSDQLGSSRLGSAGRRSHPVGVKYVSADESYLPLAAVEAAGLPLPHGRIQCTTCHDPHNTHRHEGMLRVSNQRSRLCLTCHRL